MVPGVEGAKLELGLEVTESASDTTSLARVAGDRRENMHRHVGAVANGRRNIAAGLNDQWAERAIANEGGVDGVDGTKVFRELSPWRTPTQ